MRLTKEQLDAYKKFFLESIDGENYSIDTTKMSDKEKIQFVYDTFVSEFYHWQRNKNHLKCFAEYLSGLPSTVNIPFANYDILQLAERIMNVKLTEKQEDRILENYWNFMSNLFFKLARHYKINL